MQHRMNGSRKMAAGTLKRYRSIDRSQNETVGWVNCKNRCVRERENGQLYKNNCRSTTRKDRRLERRWNNLEIMLKSDTKSYGETWNAE